jgi:hypothetical protein
MEAHPSTLVPVMTQLWWSAARAALAAALFTGGVLLLGDVALPDLALRAGLGAAVWLLFSLAVRHRLIALGAVRDVPPTCTVVAATRPDVSAVKVAAWLLVVGAVTAGLVALGEDGAIPVGFPVGGALADLAVAANDRHWESRTGKQLLVPDDDGDLHLYARERPAS